MYDWLGVMDYLRKHLLINDRSDSIYVFSIKTNFLSCIRKEHFIEVSKI